MGCTASMPEAGQPAEHLRLDPRATQGQPLMTVKVISAELNRTFDQFGKMDPFAVVQVVESDGSFWEMARTATDWGGHMTPKWDHSCRGILYHGKEGGGRLRFQVYEKNFGDLVKATFCGEVTVTAAELVTEVEGQRGQWASVCTMNLVKNGEVTGTISVQAGLAVEASRGGIGFTLVDSRRFEAPVRPAAREECQGAAPCFSLRLKSPQGSELPDRWVGKDANAGATEVPFYERFMALAVEGPGELAPLLEFMLDYAGVAECSVEGRKSGGQPKQMMVLQNLAAGTEYFRMLDIKMGEHAIGGLKEKESRFGMLKQSIAQGLNFEAKEGFFLDAFVGQPAALRSRNPLIHTLCEGNVGMRDKAIRVMLQRMSPGEMFMHFVDIHLKPTASRSALVARSSSHLGPPSTATGTHLSLPPNPSDQVSRSTSGCTAATTTSTASPVIMTPALPMDEAAMAASLSPTEMAELAMGEVVRQLAKLAVACRKAPAPQNWLRSSVAVCFDSAPVARLRVAGGVVDESTLSQIAKVKIHNWGNSELVTTKEAHMALNPDQRKERVAHWRCYRGGVDRLAWEAARAYHQRFCTSSALKEIEVTVLDFDSASADDVIGSVNLPVTDAEEKTVTLSDSKGNTVVGKTGEASITYSMKYRDFPRGARLQGAWCVTIHKASNLTVCDKVLGSSDPYASLRLLNEDCKGVPQNTAVVPKNLNPTWNECFEFVLAPEGAGHLEQLLHSAAPGLFSDCAMAKLFPPVAADEAEVKRAVSLWAERLTASASGAARTLASASGGA